ncbi:uncharacterized protein LOC130264103 [Oenanthe melanoleuca]|uniref:uncharacterized protein LOC130264103 n=1 Tax=Oenanthe melanoleuca TaxID=2939378 RepID=UPI0024C1A4CD|nr:uncharacterized protein LOC130264103 [Oenanthe melanoleuca]
MDLVTRLVCALLLLALLLAVAPSPAVGKELCPQPCHCPRRGRLDCRHTGLATVPPGSRHWPLAVLDFTGNSIAAVGKKAWKYYPWTETLVLRDNELRAVKSHSLEGLFLLKHLDLSCNEIVSIEERAFEPLPFLKLLNLSGNGLTHIPSGTFQAWHGMQFLQELILSCNPLAVIADPAFFKLPLVSSLDLSGTQATPQMLLLLLQTTLSLETLQVPKEVACCLCQERPLPESPCRSIQFLCEKLCSSSAPQCAHTSLLQTRAEIMDMEQPRKLNTSPVLSLKPMEPSLGGHGTVTLAVALTQSNEGDVSSLDNSRSSSYPPQHLLGHKGKTSVDDLRAKLKKKLLKKKLLKAERIKNVKSLVPYRPPPARLKNVVENTSSSWDQKQQDSRLNWKAMNPWDVGGALNPTHDKSPDRHLRDEVEDEAARQNYGSTHKQPKKGDSQHWVGHNQLFYETLSPVQAEGQPRATPVKAEQLLNRNLDFLSDPLVQSRPAVSSRAEATAEGEHSSLGWHPLIIPDTTEEADSMFLNKPRRAHSPHLAPVPGELLETTVSHHLRLLVPDKGLQRFMAHMERALRMDCSLPQLKHACAKMVSKAGLLLKVLSERQENQGASDHMSRCRLQENISRRTALEENQELTEKPEPETMDDTITFVVLLSIIAIILLILKGVFHVCSRCAAPVCRQLLSSQLWLRRLSLKLQQRWRKNKYRELVDAEQDLPELSEAELLLVQYIMDVLDKEEEEMQKQMQKENTDVLQGQTHVKIYIE